MSFLVAVQSLVFYVVACSPCHQAVHQRHLKQQAKKQREAQEAERAESGGYQQPEPFTTNPYWSEEIRMGPHIERKKYKSPSQRHLTSAGGDTVSVGGSSIVVNHINPNSTGSPTKENEKPKASIGRGSMSSITNLDAPSLASESGYQLSPGMTIAPPHNWNHKRYQREDEELWGSEISRTSHKLMDAIKHAGSSAGRFIESSLSKDARQLSDDEDEGSRYFLPVNPPVNDYHPPIVRRIPFKGAVRWMVQPPPPAKLMEGKVPVSRGSSVASRRATPMDKFMDSGVPVSRGSSMSNLSRHATQIDKVTDGVVTVGFGGPASNLSPHATPNDDRNTGGRSNDWGGGLMTAPP
ncbi:hypothetical protein F4823DRAFT_133194 [Ustulina deusta]|nr:hypothetical protein F4823DRAFT_133194 [Ustulina deusta]